MGMTGSHRGSTASDRLGGMLGNMIFRQVFDPELAQYAYLLGCQRTREAVIIDPERDINRYLQMAAAEGLKVTAVTETHIHADFLSGVREFLASDPAITAYLSAEGGEDWSYTWPAGEDNVKLLRDGDSFRIGGIEVRAVHTPGHTPEHLSFAVVDRGSGADEELGLVSGDFVFVGDLGRPDLLETAAGVAGAMEPSARRLFSSASWFLDQPDHLQVWPGHGAGSACGKALGAVPQSTVGYERRFSPALKAAQADEDTFVGYILDGQPEPPAYFARMKRLNRDGAPILGRLPQPPRLAVDEAAALDPVETTVLDTRTLAAWCSGHLPGALCTPSGKMFANFAGSYADPEHPVVIVADEGRIEGIVRVLVRIGIDRVVGFIVPETLEQMETVATGPATLNQVAEQIEAGVSVLDVRSASEYAAGHLPGAVNIAYTRLAPRMDEVPQGDELIVHCEIGARAVPAASFLERCGRRPTVVVDQFTPWLRSRREAVAS